MHIRKTLILLIIVVLVFSLAGCGNSATDDSVDNGSGTTYNVKLEVNATNLGSDGMVIDWRMGSDDGTTTISESFWEKEGTCGKGEKLRVTAVSEAENSSLDAAIYIDGAEAVTGTGQWSETEGQTGVVIETTTPE